MHGIHRFESPIGPRGLLLTVLGVLCPALLACSHPYGVENRETPVHVWLTVPGLAAEGGSIDALVYLGPIKVVEGPVRFPKGVPTVQLQTIYTRTGPKTVSAVFSGGAFSARGTVDVEGESWVQIIVQGRRARIVYEENQPSPWGR